MKPVERFFRKYFLSMVSIIALFLLLNVVLFFSVQIWAWQTSETLDLSISEIRDSITLDGTGHLTAAGELAEMLEKNHAWAMVLDDTGTVIFQSQLPEELPRRYTTADVAKFSRWYLGDYPVYVQEHPQGLLVVGGEKGSQAKYYFSVNESYVRKLLVGLAAVFLTNIIVVVLLIWKNTRHIEKAALSGETMQERAARETALRDYLIDRVLAEMPYTRLNGHRQDRLSNNAHFCFRFIEGESLLILLDQRGICGSSGSACTSGARRAVPCASRHRLTP